MSSVNEPCRAQMPDCSHARERHWPTPASLHAGQWMSRQACSYIGPFATSEAQSPPLGPHHSWLPPPPARSLAWSSQVNEVIRACPRSRQTLLFSATISSNVKTMVQLALDKPLQVKVDPTFNVATNLQQEFVRLRPSREHEREAVLLSLCTRTFRNKCIIFLSSKQHAHRVKVLFGLFGLVAAELHGNLTQAQRLEALDDFREGKADFLLATDLAGRGLDIRGVATVINYELPTELKTYIHRVGRTARAGSDGRAVSIVAERDRAFLKQVLKHAADVVKTRTVPPESIEHWVEKIGTVEAEVREVLQEEKEEKAIRIAEMEVRFFGSTFPPPFVTASGPAASFCCRCSRCSRCSRSSRRARRALTMKQPWIKQLRPLGP